ncbi:MAG: tyrosine-type recombinase/integrase [Candidatus Omnitrophica bacterium]|nr:tyrosine-type recombinase/integrase [Candidatus Omnitrophota bacterium]
MLKKRKVEIAERKFLDIRREEKIKFEDFAEEYLELHCKPNNKSWRGFDRHNINALKKYFSGKCLYEITPLLVEKFKAERVKEVSPATVNRNLACLKSMFNRAIEWGKAKENPVKKVKLFRENNKRLRYLEKEEIIKLLANCNKHLRPIVVVALNTGMRKGEILGLKWHDVDFRRGIIYLLNTKNGEKREIPMNEQVKTALIRVRKHLESPYIFCKPDGKPYGNVRKSFYTALKKSGIINFRFHDLRHTFASQLVMSGVDLNTVRELMGHKSLEMTLRYSHLSPDHKKRAVDILNKRMDTFWTPEVKSESGEKKTELVTLSNIIS